MYEDGNNTGLDQPLISPLSRKYYNYATEQDSRKHHRAGDIRICLEKICNEIIVDMVSDEDRAKWSEYDLHEKLKASRQCLDSKKLVKKLIKAKIIGNKGAHDGEEGDYDEKDIEEAIEAIKEFSLEIFVSYFVRNGFNTQKESWMPTVFSTLPPIYRIQILEKYHKKDNSAFVIDKLSKAYLKNGNAEQAEKYLKDCYEKGELTNVQYWWLMNDVSLLKAQLHKLPISKDLENARNNFNSLLPYIGEEKSDGFVCLVSSILNGKDVNR